MFQALNSPVKNWHGTRVWLVGASSGIGAALARAFLDAGATVALSARRTTQLEAVANNHPKALVLPFDVQDKIAWTDAHEKIKTSLGGCDLVLFCAARYKPERSWEMQSDDVAETLKTNLHSVYEGLCALIPSMIARGSGGIGIVASVAGNVGLPNASVYGPSKAALINLSELLYCDLHSKNINVYLINPGFVKTELTEKNSFFMPALQTPEQAASAILRGMEKGQFEIHFPRRFTNFLKLLQLFPYRWRFYLFQRFLTQE